jgi:hypothetical protein
MKSFTRGLVRELGFYTVTNSPNCPFAVCRMDFDFLTNYAAEGCVCYCL